MAEQSSNRMDFEKLVELTFTDRRGFLKFMAKGVAVVGLAGMGAQILPLKEFLEPEHVFMGDWKGNFPVMQLDGRLKLTDDKGSRFITREDLDRVATPGAQALLTFLWADNFWPGMSPGGIGSLKTESGELIYLAVSKKCTHEGCSVYYKDGDWFCPCHAARFASRTIENADPKKTIKAGQVLSGPPPVGQQTFEVRFIDSDQKVKLVPIDLETGKVQEDG